MTGAEVRSIVSYPTGACRFSYR